MKREAGGFVENCRFNPNNCGRMQNTIKNWGYNVGRTGKENAILGSLGKTRQGFL